MTFSELGLYSFFYLKSTPNRRLFKHSSTQCVDDNGIVHNPEPQEEVVSEQMGKFIGHTIVEIRPTPKRESMPWLKIAIIVLIVSVIRGLLGYKGEDS